MPDDSNAVMPPPVVVWRARPDSLTLRVGLSDDVHVLWCIAPSSNHPLWKTSAAMFDAMAALVISMESGAANSAVNPSVANSAVNPSAANFIPSCISDGDLCAHYESGSIHVRTARWDNDTVVGGYTIRMPAGRYCAILSECAIELRRSETDPATHRN